MKNHFYIVFILLFTFLFSQNSYAVVNPVEGPAKTEVVSKSNTTLSRKDARKMKRFQRRAERRVKFTSWMSNLYKKAAGDDDDVLIAILLAIFLGGLGIHRVYLGSKPIIVLWYFLTLGGIFGIIPLIDLIRIAMGNISDYRDNDKFFVH